MQTAFCFVSSKDIKGYLGLNGFFGSPFSWTWPFVVGTSSGSDVTVRVDMLVFVQKQADDAIKARC